MEFKHLGHEKHLCKLVIGDQLSCDEIRPLVNSPKYICHICKRLANREESLCHAEPL